MSDVRLLSESPIDLIIDDKKHHVNLVKIELDRKEYYFSILGVKLGQNDSVEMQIIFFDSNINQVPGESLPKAVQEYVEVYVVELLDEVLK